MTPDIENRIAQTGSLINGTSYAHLLPDTKIRYCIQMSYIMTPRGQTFRPSALRSILKSIGRSSGHKVPSIERLRPFKKKGIHMDDPGTSGPLKRKASLSSQPLQGGSLSNGKLDHFFGVDNTADRGAFDCPGQTSATGGI